MMPVAAAAVVVLMLDLQSHSIARRRAAIIVLDSHARRSAPSLDVPNGYSGDERCAATTAILRQHQVKLSVMK